MPAEINLPAYFGYSAGHWHHDTFVVETVGFNEKTTLDVDAISVTSRSR